MRAGPSGHTAAERNQTRVMDQTPPSMGSACPDEDAYVEQAWLEAKESGHPVSRRYIRQQLAAAQARYDSAEETRMAGDLGTVVLTYLSRRRSVPVDRWELRSA